MDADSIASSQSASQSDSTGSFSSLPETGTFKDDESDKQAVIESLQRRVAELEHKLLLSSFDRESIGSNESDTVPLPHQRQSSALVDAELKIAKLSDELEIRTTELRMYQQMLDIAVETTLEEKQNASRRQSLLQTDNGGGKRGLLSLFTPAQVPKRDCRPSLPNMSMPRLSRTTSDTAGSVDPAAILEAEQQRHQMHSRIWNSMIELEAIKSIDYKNQLAKKASEHEQLSKEFEELSSQLELCKRELCESRESASAMAADLKQYTQRVETICKEELIFERKRVDELKAALRLEREIVHDVAIALGEREFERISKQAKDKLSSANTPVLSTS